MKILRWIGRNLRKLLPILTTSTIRLACAGLNPALVALADVVIATVARRGDAPSGLARRRVAQEQVKAEATLLGIEYTDSLINLAIEIAVQATKQKKKK